MGGCPRRPGEVVSHRLPPHRGEPLLPTLPMGGAAHAAPVKYPSTQVNIRPKLTSEPPPPRQAPQATLSAPQARKILPKTGYLGQNQ